MRPTDFFATSRRSIAVESRGEFVGGKPSKESALASEVVFSTTPTPTHTPTATPNYAPKPTPTPAEIGQAPRGRVVVARNVVSFADGYPLLAGVTVAVDRGVIIELRGPNGAGKTSLLRLFAGLLPVHRGSLHLLGVDVAHAEHTALRKVRSQIGYVPHEYGLYGDLTPNEHVGVLGHWGDAQTSAKERKAYAQSIMQLSSRARNTPVRQLSAGQKRRTAIACAALKMPSLWLLDEPASGLDAGAKAHVADVIEHERQRGAAVVYSTHDAASLLDSDETWHLSGGCLAHFSPSTVQRNPSPTYAPVDHHSLPTAHNTQDTHDAPNTHNAQQAPDTHAH